VLRRDPARQWESYGRVDPFFGVLSADEYRRKNLTPEAVEQFYATGEEHVDALLSEHDLHPRTALDFGCGTGRVLVALARRCEQVAGVDVSPAMLAECRRACDARGLANVALSAEVPDSADGVYDLVHTMLVLQHIPVAEGQRILERLLRAVAPGGAIAFQVTLAPRLATRAFYQAVNLPLVGNLWNLVRGRAWGYPSMQMNGYRLDRILATLARRGLARTSVTFVETSDPRDLDWVFVVARF
jgi:SAM-dependent methyltransferase